MGNIKNTNLHHPTQNHFNKLETQTLDLFKDIRQECFLEGKFEAVINSTHPLHLLKLDGRNGDSFSHQIFDCEIDIMTGWSRNKSPSRNSYDDNNYLSVTIFDINHGERRKEDDITLEMSYIPNQRTREHENPIFTRFFSQKKEFQLPQYDPNQINGFLLNLDEIDNWHSEFNSSVKIDLKQWQTNDSIYFVFSQYSKVLPYHCSTGIEVDCEDSSSVPKCFPSSTLPLFLGGFPFCELRPLTPSN